MTVEVREPGGASAGPDLPASEERTVTTQDGASLAVTVAGAGGGRAAGTTVVFAHGWTNRRAVWAPVARLVADAGHRVVLYDQRGHGASTLGEEPPSIERLGDDMACVLEQLDVRDAIVVGHSMGGFTGLSFACRHPGELRSRVRGLALVATAAHGLSLGRIRPLGWIVGSRLLDRVMESRYLGHMLTRPVLGRSAEREHVHETRAMFVGTPPEVRLACFNTFGAMDLRASVAEVLADAGVPSVVLAGERDTLTPARLGQALAEVIPGARYEVLPEAGHMLPLERPSEVAEAVLSLLSM